MIVAHISPTYFGPDSLVGGAERYVTELAKAMAPKTPTRLISFGEKNQKEFRGPLEIHLYKPLWHARRLQWNPVSLGFLSSLRDVDVIHCHQLAGLVSDLAVLFGRATGKKTFATDLGNGTDLSLWYHLPMWKGIHSLLLISEFSRRRYQNIPVRAEVVYGGVDTVRFSPGRGPKVPRILHVGRILPHKGIDALLEILPPRVGLDVVGPIGDPIHYQQLLEKAQGKDVSFYTAAQDDDLIARYRSASLTVLPALADSGFTTVLESFACGTPVVATAVGSLPELVEDGVTGFLVPPGNRAFLREKVATLLAHPEAASEMGRRGRETVLKRFTWDSVVERCLQAYRTASSPAHP